IALALALNCDVATAAEPPAALDVVVEAQFLDLLRDLRDELNLTILMITHNIGVVAEVADRVAVMYAGEMAEVGDVHPVFAEPAHPYTEGLLKSVPNIALDEEELYQMKGGPPNLPPPPPGCRFNPRRRCLMDICVSQDPPVFPVHGGGGVAACWLRDPERKRSESD